LTDIELILVDDGSSDHCGKICDQYAQVDKRIKVVHKKNGGASEARNVGIDLASGNFIGFVDSDDYVDHDMYEKLYSASIRYDSDISMCGRFDVINGKITQSFSFNGNRVWSSQEAIENFLTWNNIDSSFCDKLFKKKIFDRMRFPANKNSEDIFIMPDILYSANKIVHIGESKYYYCHRKNSRSNDVFNVNKMHLLEASEYILEFILVKYPYLQKKAQSFYYCSIIHLYSLISSSSNRAEYRSQYNELKRTFHKNFIPLIGNPYIDKRNKVISVLLYLKLYRCIKNMKGLIRKG
jgi:glycosyltransferase involved in cell wall biosynthesis